MKPFLTKVIVFVAAMAWLGLTAVAEAAWPVMVMPIVLLFWLLPSSEKTTDTDEIVVHLKLLNSRLAAIDDTLRAIDSQLDEHSLKLTHLVDERLHAMRIRGEIPWP